MDTSEIFEGAKIARNGNGSFTFHMIRGDDSLLLGGNPFLCGKTRSPRPAKKVDIKDSG
jgi:hypothetical protein